MAPIRSPGSSLPRLVIMFLVFFALVGATVIVVRPLDMAMRNNIAEIRDNFLKLAENFLGRELEYGSISPSIFGTLDVRDIYIRRDDGTPFLTVSRLRISYSFWNLIRGKISEGFHSVRIDRPLFAIDLAKDNDIFDLFTLTDDAQTNFLDYLPENFQIRLRDGEWETIGNLGYASVHNFNLDGSIRANRIVFNSRWNASGALESSAENILGTFGFSSLPQTLSVSSSGRANGDFNFHLTDGSGTITIPSFQGNFFRLEPVSFSVFLRNRKLEIRKVYDKSPADIAMIWDTEAQSLDFSFSGENFSPGNLMSLTGSMRDYNRWTALRISGQANLAINEDDMNFVLDLKGALPPIPDIGNLSFVLNAAGDKSEINIWDFDVDSDSGKIGFAGSIGMNPLTPSGRLSISNLVLTPDGNPDMGLSGDLIISGSGQEIRILGENIVSGQVSLSALETSVSWDEEGLAFFCSALRLRNDDQQTGFYEASHVSGFALEGTVDYNPSRIEASVKLDSFALQDLIDFFKPLVSVPALPDITRGITENIFITTELFFTVENEYALYNAPVIVLIYGDRQLAEFSISGTDRRFEMNYGMVYLPENAVGMSGFVDFTDSHNISLSLEFSYRELVYYARGSILDNQFISITGSYGFEAFFSSVGSMGYSGYIQGDHIPIPSADNFAQFSFFVLFRYDSASFWSANIDRFEITGIAVPSSNASLSLSGNADQDGLVLSSIMYNDGHGSLAGNLLMAWDTSYRDFSLYLGLANLGDSERYRLSANFDRNLFLDIDLSVEAMQLARVSPEIANGTADGNLKVSYNSLESFRAELFLPSVMCQWQDQMISLSARASMDDSELSVDGLDVFLGSELEALIPNFRINRTEGWARTAGRIQGSVEGRQVDLAIRGEAEFKSLGNWLALGQITDSLYGLLIFDNAQYDTIKAEEPFQFAFSSVRDERGQTLSLDGGPRNMVRFRYTPESNTGGNFYAALSAPSPIRGSFTGFIDSSAIDMRVPDLYVDMGSLWQFVPPQSSIAFPGGIVTGALHVTGPLRDPEFYGSARATSLRIRVPDFIPEDIRPVPITITMDGNEMRFGPVFASIGSGSGTVSAWYQFEQWIPSVFSMDIYIPTETTIPVSFDVSGVIAKGRASGRMNLSMDNMFFTVSGDVTAHNTEITLDSDEMAALQSQDHQSPPVPTIVDLTVRSGRQVEFYWPSVQFPIIHANADQGTRLRVTSDSDSRRFSLTGDVNLRGGEVFYMERNFYLRQGTLFFNENETRFEPRISARAEIRDQSDDGPVTISMIIDNAPLMSFTARFESAPPLSQIEIYSLLGQGQSGNTDDQGPDAGVIIALTTDAIVQITVMRTVEKQVRNFLKLDMFSMRTRVLQNLAFQVTGLQSNAGVGNYFDNTTVFFGKYLGTNIFVESLLTLKYDPEKTTWSGLTLEPEIGLEMRNPLFDIRMNMLLLHPENMFIDDITFSVIWRRSF